MSSCDSDSDSESSYTTDDSDFNYIPEFPDLMLEDEENEENANTELQAASGTCLVESQTFDDVDVENLYDGEPLADEEWLSDYNKRQESQQIFERLLQDRFDGDQRIHSWCKCGNCCVDLLQNPNEFQCCAEINECKESLTSELVQQEVETTPVCVTFHPGFAQVCLQKWSLRLAADKYKTKNKERYRQTGAEEKFLRGVAYREFTRLIHGFLGRRRVPLPACAYHEIRKAFPDKSGYTGFEVEDSE